MCCVDFPFVCNLNEQWANVHLIVRLSDAKFSWVKEFKGDKHKAMCCVYNKVIVESMGESALKSHMKGEKHKWNAGASSTSVCADDYIFT